MNSTLNASAAAAIHAKKPVTAGSGKKADGSSTDAAGEFAGLFASLVAGNTGQVLADDAGKASPPANMLAAQALSPTVNIITTSTPALNDDSLLAFAKSQGMNEEAMALIFKGKAAQADTNSADAVPLTPPVADKPALDLGEGASISWSVGAEVQATPAAASGANALTPLMFGLNGLRAGLPLTAKPAINETAATAETESINAEPKSLAASLMLGNAEAAQFARRLSSTKNGNPQPIANPLAKENFASLVARVNPAAAEVTTTSTTEVRSETLIVGEDLSGADLQAVFAQRADSGNQSHDPNKNGVPATVVASQADMDVRTEQYEKLSQRLAEALGQRLSAQIARGEWKVELALKPHNLGTIDIELNMKHGELEASFKASNPATRDLINEGLPKLKEVLAQMGMDVAQVDVNARQSGQSGGNPTPGQQQQQSGAARLLAGSETKIGSAALGLKATDKSVSPQDGLDLLV